MKTYKKAVLLLAAILGLLGLLLMASFTTYDACRVANTNTVYIKEQMQLALKATNFEKSKYHTFKALKSIYTTKQNFKDCGCSDAFKQLDFAEQNLKQVIKSKGFDDAKIFLDIALKNAAICLNVLKNYDEFKSNGQTDTEFLALNTVQTMFKQDSLTLLENKELKEALLRSLGKFQRSVDDVTGTVDCEDARQFLKKVQKQTKERLQNPELSQAKIYYHQGVQQIAQNAIQNIKDCN